MDRLYLTMAIYVFWTVCLMHLCNQVRMTSAVTNFTLTTNRVTWNTAKSICEQSGERLAQIDSDEIKEFVQNGWHGHDQFWIGLFEQDDVFKWSDECDEYQYRNWAFGEPSMSANERCVSVSPADGAWKTDMCNELHMFLCEKPDSDCGFSAGIVGYLSASNVQYSGSESYTSCYNLCTGSSIGTCWAFAHAASKGYCQIYLSNSPITLYNAVVKPSSFDFKTYFWTCHMAFLQSVTIDYSLIDDRMQPVTQCIGEKRTTESITVSSTKDAVTTSGPVTTETITTVEETSGTQTSSTVSVVPTEEDTTTNTPGNDVTITQAISYKNAITTSGPVTTETVATVQDTSGTQSPSTVSILPTEEDTTTNTPGNDVTITQTISYTDAITTSGPVTAETVATVQGTKDTQSPSTASIVPTEDDTKTNTPENDITITHTNSYQDTITTSRPVTAETVATVQGTKDTQSPSTTSIVLTEEDTTTNTPGNDVTITQTNSYKDDVTASCDCSCQITYTPTNESKTAFTTRIIEELDVPKTSVSSYKRKHISAPDNRLMARGIGYAGLAFLVIVFGSLILLDIPRLAQEINRLRKTILELFRKD